MAHDTTVLKCDLTQQQIRLAADYGMSRWSQRFVSAIEALIPASGCESPIEAAFFAWWHAYVDVHGLNDVLVLKTQHDVVARDNTYRLDFVIWPMDFPEVGAWADLYEIVPPEIGVELDGYEFHERTKEQVALRNKRDRDLTAAGWTILHFSGSEFVRHPERAIEEVTQTALKTYTDLRIRLAKLDGQRDEGKGNA